MLYLVTVPPAKVHVQQLLNSPNIQPGYSARMTDKKPTPTPLPARTGKTLAIAARLRQRRRDMGITQEELGQRVYDYANRNSIRFDERKRWKKPPSKSAIAQWEAMFPLDGQEVNDKLKDRRVSFSMNDYACWARALGMRLVVDLVDMEEPRQARLVTDQEAALLDRFANLPESKRQMIAELVGDVAGNNSDE